MTIIEVAGQGGQVSFDGQFVTIHRKGFLARTNVGKGEKRIPTSSIMAVQWKPAGPIINGFIQFTVPGGNERRSKFGSQTTDAAHDENSVVFTRKQMPEFEKLRAVVEGAIAQRGMPAPSAAPVDAADQIARLAQLHQSGALSDEEFTSAKARLLGL
jgi:hypothetical protein